ncbi:peptidyl-prolyl cis-trans isomerase [Actinomycetospora endophytica]|uniref:Peptidyl-prolyl cis-trans isomerase n=1 Tax=Actinomycetospora endophytica TaxID=2291215 RepID=A0ABS8P8I9_9PSEU|nr:peptidyl-prolyl cis-trans isomerase [Actinomycetospora endophytica]MCD2194573.1 peptidyl-prolyl cis-trans isomerase [Actinomycetospora endophytica]
MKSPPPVLTEPRADSDEAFGDAAPDGATVAARAATPSWTRMVAALRDGPRIVPRGRTRLTAVVAALVVMLGAIAQIVVHEVTTLPADAALRVDGTTVSEADFRQRIDLLAGLYGAQPPTDPAGRDHFERDAAQAVAASMVLDDVATAQNVVVPDTVAQDALNKIIQQKFPQGRQGFDQALANLKVSEGDVLAEIKRQLTTARLFDQVTAPAPPVTDADVAAAYAQRRGQFVVPEKRHLRNIVAPDQATAQQILTQLQGGADFAGIATASSADKSTSQAGGDLGALSKDQLEPAIGNAAFGAAAGALYGPVQGSHGWNVGQVLEVAPAQQLSLDQVRDQLRGQLDDERRLALWRPWLSQQIRAADIAYADRYQPADPNALPAGMTP